MKFCSQCKQDKPKSEFYIRKIPKDGLSCWCKQCTRIKSSIATKKWNDKHPNVAKDKMSLLRKSETFVKNEREAERKRYNANPEKFIAKTKKWQEENPLKRKDVRAKWWEKNHGARNASRMKRHAAKLRATPLWANEFFIKEIYNLASMRSKMLGVNWHVDHIVPLQSEFVCGLHVETNMQLLPSKHNQSKGNRVWPDMP